MHAYMLVVGDELAPDDLGRGRRIIAFSEDPGPANVWHLVIERENGTTYDQFVGLLDEVLTLDEHHIIEHTNALIARTAAARLG